MADFDCSVEAMRKALGEEHRAVCVYWERMQKERQGGALK
eukprot:CAMPEP_0183784012 /NCGR_PEP_ID=MMETSP0739-20130205/64922_1 /TAXON_ID=385413 /ORGANISM="Thalassiosira miniscula, Strain CCMP1093" /LENGTH=39 /DNA_ID= /DNA_START= /DNA_END= /DNA_ORIENTATION=